MEINDILKLVNAGFTANQIIAMSISTNTEAVEDKTNTENNEDKTNTENNEENKETANFKAMSDSIIQAIGDLKNTIISSNNHINIGQNKSESVDDILATIINPNRGENK